jgi:hypothetical protein
MISSFAEDDLPTFMFLLVNIVFVNNIN